MLVEVVWVQTLWWPRLKNYSLDGLGRNFLCLFQGSLGFNWFYGGGPGVSLTLCCFVVYSTRRFVVCLSMCHFVLVFFSPFSIAITSLGEERANLSAFRTFARFVLVWICRFPLPLGFWEGLRFVIVALPGPFSYLFFLCSSIPVVLFDNPRISECLNTLFLYSPHLCFIIGFISDLSAACNDSWMS